MMVEKQRRAPMRFGKEGFKKNSVNFEFRRCQNLRKFFCFFEILMFIHDEHLDILTNINETDMTS